MALGIFYFGIIVLAPLNSFAYTLPEYVSGFVPTPNSVVADFVPWVIRWVFLLGSLSIVVGLLGLPFVRMVKTGNFDFDQSMILAKNHGWRVAFSLFLLGFIPPAILVFWRISVGQLEGNDNEMPTLLDNWILVFLETLTPIIYAVPYVLIGSLVLVTYNRVSISDPQAAKRLSP